MSIVEGVETALMFGCAQIVEGEATCAYCDRPAVMTVWNGADPDHELVCFGHAQEWIGVTQGMVASTFGPKAALKREDAPPANGTGQ